MWDDDDGNNGGGDDYARRYDGEDEGDDGGDADMDLSKRSALTATIDQIAFDDEDERHARQRQQQQQSLGDATAVRAEEQVIDSVAYYNLVSLWCSLYIRTKEGFALPIVFDAQTQHMVRSKRHAKFDF